MVQLTQDANAKSAQIKEKLLSPNVTEQIIDYVPNQFIGKLIFSFKISPLDGDQLIIIRSCAFSNLNGVLLKGN